MLITLSSCGYHTADQEETLSIPYFKGDSNGLLTEAVIRAVSASGHYVYTHQSGHLRLDGKIVSDEGTHIGYQYDRDPTSGKRIHRLVPNEGRREITVEITLVDSRTEKILYGPENISAYTDYDFVDSDSLRDTSFINQNGARESSLLFSMGQLDSITGAKETAYAPVCQRLALKIVEGISNLPYNAE
ncbi:MAG: hypothetical protein KDK63_01185 [Chlamydiia bacterium]|nr:hypothetical protein [Chlamydiia bacterium]MCB1116408.1 hypothetical protein [Chlamydiia bacterium]